MRKVGEWEKPDLHDKVLAEDEGGVLYGWMLSASAALVSICHCGTLFNLFGLTVLRLRPDIHYCIKGWKSLTGLAALCRRLSLGETSPASKQLKWRIWHCLDILQKCGIDLEAWSGGWLGPTPAAL